MCLPHSTCHDSVLASPEMSWRRTGRANGRKPRGPMVGRSSDPDLSYLNGSSLSAPESTNYSLGASIYSIHSRDNMPWGTWRDHSLTNSDRTDQFMCACAESTPRRRATARLSPSPQRRELLGTRRGSHRTGACAAVCARESSGARQTSARAPVREPGYGRERRRMGIRQREEARAREGTA